MSLARAFRSTTAGVVLGLLASTAAACATGDDHVVTGDDDLTSVTARSRRLEFVGKVFVQTYDSDSVILQAVRTQAQTGFGPLRVAEMAVRSRELKEIDTSTFVKRNVKVVDPKTGTSRDMVEVTYTYKDDAVVAVSYARRSAVPLALMSPDYGIQIDRVMRECTKNDKETREFQSSAWYIFEPTIPRCAAAIEQEQATIDADRKRLANPKTEVSESEVGRLYLPITAQLGADKTNRGNSYPDYQRLFAGGVEKDKLVVSLVFGLIDHDDGAERPSQDSNWGELMTTLGLVFDTHGDFAQVDGPDPVDLKHFDLPSGRAVESPSFADLVRLKYGGSSLKLSASDASSLQAEFAERIDQQWVALEKPIRVAVGTEAPRDFAIRLMVYFGASYSTMPHKFATKNSDVFIYNGHSSIGYGPLDPKNFTTSDFPASYQLFWMDGCVSYNYYNKDYLPLKSGGTQNLDLVTNGIESDAYESGLANGKFLAALLGGKASYRELLLAAKATEALRVVDGELDNEFDPKSPKTKVTITARP